LCGGVSRVDNIIYAIYIDIQYGSMRAVIIGLLLTILLVAGFLLLRPKAVAVDVGPPVVPHVDTTFVGMDTTPHDALRELVDTSDPDTDTPVSFDRDLTHADAEFIVDQICRRASNERHEFVRGNVIAKELLNMGVLGTMVHVAAVVHTKTQSVRFASIVEWDGSHDTGPVVRSVTFDDLEPNQGHLTFDTYEWKPVADEYRY
jgi:hypothetical protein